MGKSSEFQNFDNLMRQLVRVPHDELKARLEAEKRAKAAKPKREQKSRRGDSSC